MEDVPRDQVKEDEDTSSDKELIVPTDSEGGLVEGLLRYERLRFTGPLPPPALLAEYEDIEPGFANRIMTMTERNGEHRREMERTNRQESNKLANLGLKLGATVTVVAFLTSIALAALGAEWAASIVGGGTIVSLAGTFVYGSRGHWQELFQKRKQMDESPRRRTNDEDEDA